MGWGDDIHLGSFSEIGESLRGLQDANMIGASAQALGQLRGALGQLAQQHFGQHMPAQKPMRSAFKDSTQIGIKVTGTLTPASWTGSVLPQFSGLTRVYKSFKPTKAILTEKATFTWQNSTLGLRNTAVSVADSADVVLVQAFSGADNCFPNAPTQDNGISGPTFANNSLGNGISWPTINGGIDMTVAFAVEDTLLYQGQPPSGYSQGDLQSIALTIRFNLLGPSLR